MAAILGRKVGMTQVFDAQGNLVPVTLVEAQPNVVVGVRTPERDGYRAVQLGFEEVPERRVNRPLRGVFRRAGVSPRRVIREVRLPEGEDYQVGQEISVTVFREGDRVAVTGTSKGKGFAGAMKRHGFGGQADSHGVSLMHRAVGSLGTSGVGRVWKGKRMPGRMGGERVTIRGLRVVRVDPERHLLLIRGAIPGPRGGLVMVRRMD
ncbi:MAG: 50S ribosomal protein L3 [Armatimonadota bacterium]|nr:50S ribosomal protein L3 [Armatimonadota bacterium]MDR5675221.1 50S ribosomal protein L3 [Armatimonadota bacterium]MDR5690175.1 50S ribosomal protein L3 [Armatimonadota bacterium]MDR7387387.1 50S ribosomal protein L3 [Armatimonadota bacterium]MDR7389788.1 50S ribosomal protein L3 [Armatimonadota bacterium]